MGLICLVEELGSRGTLIFWKTLQERFPEFWKVHFTTFDRDVICSTSPGIFKGSQVLGFFGSQTFPSSRISYLKHVRVLGGMCLKWCPLSNILLPMHV